MLNRTDSDVCQRSVWLRCAATQEGRGRAGYSSTARLRLRVDLNVDGVAAALAAQDRHAQRLGDEVHAEPVLADLPDLRSGDSMQLNFEKHFEKFIYYT